MPETRVANFGAGPSALPPSVLEEAAKALINFENTGIGIAELSHRSKEFGAHLSGIEKQIRTQLDVPSTHSILFLQGGGSGEFSAVVLNMMARHRLLYPQLKDEERVMDYVVTGSWSAGAIKEAHRLAGGSTVNVVADGRNHSADGKSFDKIPPRSAYKFSQNPAFIYYCENETVNGVQFSNDEQQEESFPFDLLPEDKLLPLVGDHSSSFMSRPIPRLADHAIIFAGAQKNIGPAGVTIVIVRQDCIVDVDAAAKLGAVPVPVGLAYKTFLDGKNLPNTPAVFSLYVCGLVLKRSAALGGMKYYEELNKRKQEKLYTALREGEERGVIKAHVKPGSGSWMNIVFTTVGEGSEARFLAGAEEKGMKGLKGHRSVGGIRASLYNAVTEEQVDQLVAYIREFVDSELAEQANTVQQGN